jgi:hypothetical protein
MKTSKSTVIASFQQDSERLINDLVLDEREFISIDVSQGKPLEEKISNYPENRLINPYYLALVFTTLK